MRIQTIVGIIFVLLFTLGVVIFIPDSDRKEGKLEVTNSIRSYSIVIIDGCEYIEGRYGIIHKANCKNHVALEK